MNQQLILVNEKDEEIGFGEKLHVHQNAQLHRAFSIFVVNSRDQLLLQRRAFHKYHSGGLWANTCCSHPIRGEKQEDTIHRRLTEEMGFDCELSHLFHFIYRAELDNGLTEYEYDHVYLGSFEGTPIPNPEEVAAWRWMHLDYVRRDINEHPDAYTYWIRQAFDQFYSQYYNDYLS
jgi:isopentenyl-diphosphate delta-isomerase